MSPEAKERQAALVLYAVLAAVFVVRGQSVTTLVYILAVMWGATRAPRWIA